MYYCQQLTLSVCLFVCHKLQIASFLFLDGIVPFFCRQFSMTPSTKRFSSIFDLGPLTPKIYSPFFHKIAYKSACMADRPEMFGPTRGFSGMADSMEPCKMLWADSCCHGNEIWDRREDPVAYRLVIIIIVVVVTSSSRSFYYLSHIPPKPRLLLAHSLKTSSRPDSFPLKTYVSSKLPYRLVDSSLVAWPFIILFCLSVSV